MANEDGGVDGLTPEQIQAIVTERDQAKAVAAEKDAALKNTVEEIKSLRKSKQELEKEKVEWVTASSQSSTTQGLNIDELVEKKLTEKLTAKEQEEAKIQEDIAWKEFVSSHPEFTDEQDASGIRRETLKKELSRFNLSGARKKDDFLSAMKDAVTLLYRKENREYTSPYASSPTSGGGNPPIKDSSSLNARERDTMKRLGWDAKKMVETRIKHPELYNSLFNE